MFSKQHYRNTTIYEVTKIFCINENYFKNRKPSFTIVRFMLMIIIKHGSLNHNKISMKKLKYQESENISDFYNSYFKKPEKHHAIVWTCSAIVRKNPDKTTIKKKQTRDSECKTLQQIAVTIKMTIMDVWICTLFTWTKGLGTSILVNIIIFHVLSRWDFYLTQNYF